MGYTEFRDSEVERLRKDWQDNKPVPTVYRKKFEREQQAYDRPAYGDPLLHPGVISADPQATIRKYTARLISEASAAKELAILDALTEEAEPEPEPSDDWVTMGPRT